MKMGCFYNEEIVITTLVNKWYFLLHINFLPNIGFIQIYGNNLLKYIISNILSPAAEGYVLIDL